jgi:hypothetical protein
VRPIYTMSSFSIQEILSLVEKPSRYLGNETNVVCKPPEAVKLAMVLAFPDLYEIGTSHFGIQILYHLLNSRENICAERVFAPGADMEEQLRKSKEPLLSLESRRPLKTFDIVGFSLLYELNYTNMINMLALSQYSLAKRRAGRLIPRYYCWWSLCLQPRTGGGNFRRDSGWRWRICDPADG